MTNSLLPRVVFRANGNSQIGLGHVVRCLALADMLQSDFTCVFAIQEPDEQVEKQISKGCAEVWLVPSFSNLQEEAEWLLQQLRPTDIVVLDGYHFTPAYAYSLWSRPQPVVNIDDLLAQDQWSDVVINQAGGIKPGTYQTVPGAELCLGPAYALLRRPFQFAAQKAASIPDVQQVFLNMGGADPHNHTLTLLHQLRQRFPGKAIEVVTGAAYPHQADLEQQIQDLKHVTLHHNIPAEKLAALLHRCGIHVCPPSGMAYECCAVGGLLFLHPIADNQRYLLAYLTEAKLALPYSELAHVPEAELLPLAQSMTQRQRQVFDGAAGSRFRKVFEALYGSYQLTIRHAQSSDAAQYFTWANDPAVRRNAIHTAPIEWDVHVRWFSRRVAATDSFLYIFEQVDQAVGQVRIDFEESVGTIDYSVAAAYRGQGMGLAILRRALGLLRREKQGAWTLLGQVKSDNLASCRVFQRLGFIQQPTIRQHDENYEVFRLEVASVNIP
ncbi:UDP-2,4-diacetamido-2,4,6-trideoxy-beta-L-altropyranose hydrolase [Hymenobacter sp. BT730]|uniref:UDP-2,4-diacetamido-2,4, 6-trideoxy-beta-L-altropyranose hydrolase n=1 Tax=Hymenobacter sp. BT730 TaxID=3063332 RepID=UPI0026E0200C|nr:UDP-2,4-diacetamido-2,4,6-trideoxy-beta-L-altropyranose hydrolase [Hymenobacter sp. BT730]